MRRDFQAMGFSFQQRHFSTLDPGELGGKHANVTCFMPITHAPHVPLGSLNDSAKFFSKGPTIVSFLPVSSRKFSYSEPAPIYAPSHKLNDRRWLRHYIFV